MISQIFLIIVFVQIVLIVGVKNESSCVNDECTTLGSDGILESTTSIEEHDFSTEEEQEEIKNEESVQKSGNEVGLRSSNDEFHIVKLPNPAVLNNTINNTDVPLSKKEPNVMEDQPANEKPQTVPVQGSETEKTETTTQPNTNTTTNTTKETNPKHHHLTKNQTEICICDLKVSECDINCCCDTDCNDNMKTVFTKCVDSVGKVSSQFCFNSQSIFKNNLETNSNVNGLLCIVRNNLHPHIQFTDEMIIDNVTKFNERISRKRLFNYSPLQLAEPKMQKIPYRFGDYVWAVSGNYLLPFGIPMQTMNMQCKSKQNVHYLTDYTTECLRAVPHNAEQCGTALELGMDHYLNGIQLIRSPALITPTNTSDKVCSDKTCVPIKPYVCEDETDLSSCVESTPKRLQWDNTCRNVVSSVEYHIYHNGTDGVKEVRAYFTLTEPETDSFRQKIGLKFLWVTTRSQVFKRSGNPGYIIGKPIMSGRKVYSSNETMSVRKEAIELSYNPEDWLTVVGSAGGACSPGSRRPVGFGENARHTCFVNLGDYDYHKTKCGDLQDDLFGLLLGEDDLADVKTAGSLNKFVASFGNSGVEDTRDWVRVIIDALPVVSGQVTYADFVVCKNVVSDLFVDVAYSRVGSFERPQNKILGVRVYFGSPSNVVYYTNPSCSRYGTPRRLVLSSYVHFIDLTSEPHAEFAETPGFEAKLPHDFFYPFFSACSGLKVHFFLVFVPVFMCVLYLFD